jgi:hypothetical protein
MTDELRARFVEEAPREYLPMRKHGSGSAFLAKPCCSV